MRGLLKAAESVSRIGVWTGGLMLIGAAAFMSIEVILRKIFLIGVGGAPDIGGYVLAVSSAWAFSFALLRKAHVRVDVVHRLMPRVARRCLDFLALISLVWFSGMLVWHGIRVLATSVVKGSHDMTPLGTPLWLPQGAWFVGLLLFAAVALLMLVRASWMLVAGQGEAVDGLIGPVSAAAEAEEEAGLEKSG